MRVTPDQLRPGCLLLNHVKGKTAHPIIAKDTVLTDEHIHVLKRFLVEEVNVSPKLASGEQFIPKSSSSQKKKKIKSVKQSTLPKESFDEHYLETVDYFKTVFKEWQLNVPLNMANIRKQLIPLLNRINELKDRIFTLHQYANMDNYIYHHCVSVGLLSAFLAKQMGYPNSEWLQVGLAGALSDSGMSKVNENVLHKSNSLTERELEKIKNHPVYSYRLIEKSPLMTQAAKTAVLQHHERRDGSGYPIGLKGDKIQPYAQIIAVCDIYHAMTCNRYFQSKTSPFLVIEEIEAEQFTKLDPFVVQSFKRSIAHFSIGTKVKLSNAEQAEIVFTDSNQPTRPMIKLLTSALKRHARCSYFRSLILN